MINYYEINSKTAAIIPYDKEISKIIEEDQELLINNKTLNIIDHSCRYFGSSYLGRVDGTKELLGYNYKAPIIIEESNSIIFFPTSSPRQHDCNWISLNHIYKFENHNNKTILVFKNGNIVDLKVSNIVLENQILRATRLKSVLEDRKNLKK